MADLVGGPRYSRIFAITPSDTKPIQGPLQADGTHTPYCEGFLCTVSGNLVATGRNNRGASSVTFPVTAGLQYDIGLSMVYVASTASIIGLL
jgi:hypothetical protein